MSLPPRRATWSFPTHIRFGAGRIAELPRAAEAAGIARPLFVTDPGLAGLAMTEAALASLPGARLFAGVSPNPKDRDLAAGIEAYRAGGHDGVVAFGGGSAMDLGKLVAFQAGQTRPVADFEDREDWWKRADAAAIAPVVAVPTTAGTGSEVGRAAVLTDTGAGVKRVIFHPAMLPAQVIADPELTRAMPHAVTAGTGADALAHCLEAYCAPSYHPMAAGIALEGIRLVGAALPKVLADPDDLDARADMMAAAMMGAVAFQKGLGAVHALSHPIGAMADTHHGTTNAVLIPAVLAFNRREIQPGIERAAAYLGLEPSFDAFLDWIGELLGATGLPRGLGALGIDRALIPAIARAAPLDPTASGNPRPFTETDAAEILAAAW